MSLLLSLSGHRFGATLMLFRVCHCSVTNPRAALVVTVSGAHPITVTWAITAQHVVELIPLDRPKVIRLTLFIPYQLRVRNRKSKKLGLRHGLVNESLSQLVIGKELDLPPHRLVPVSRLPSRRPLHHQRRPPPAIQSILRHRLLFLRTSAQAQHNVESLTLMKALFFTDSNHRACIWPIGAAAQRNLVDD